jgi:hypothetical protein
MAHRQEQYLSRQQTLSQVSLTKRIEMELVCARARACSCAFARAGVPITKTIRKRDIYVSVFSCVRTSVEVCILLTCHLFWVKCVTRNSNNLAYSTFWNTLPIFTAFLLKLWLNSHRVVRCGPLDQAIMVSTCDLVKFVYIAVWVNDCCEFATINVRIMCLHVFFFNLHLCVSQVPISFSTLQTVRQPESLQVRSKTPL